MKLKAKDISEEVAQNGGATDDVDWKELWSDGYDAVIIDDAAFSFSRFGLEDKIAKNQVVR